jgi:hypothetical protein
MLYNLMKILWCVILIFLHICLGKNLKVTYIVENLVKYHEEYKKDFEEYMGYKS